MVPAESNVRFHAPVYEFKPGPYSSHTRVLGMFPPDGEGRRVLDVGCGNGYLGEILAARGYRVTGLERSEGVTSAFPPSVEFVEADLENGLPALAGKFDYVICADVLEHLRNPGELLRQVRDVLEPGGCLIASLPNSGNIYFRLNILFGRFPRDDKGLFDRTHVQFYMLDGWRDVLDASGFSIGRLAPTGIPVGLALSGWTTTWPVLAAEWMCYLLARLWKKMFAYQFVVEARPARPLP